MPLDEIISVYLDRAIQAATYSLLFQFCPRFTLILSLKLQELLIKYFSTEPATKWFIVQHIIMPVNMNAPFPKMSTNKMRVEKLYESENYLVVNKPYDMYINSDNENEKVIY